MNCSIKLANSKQNVCATNSKYDDDYVMYILINENMATNIEKVMTTCCNVISKIIREIESAGKIDGYTTVSYTHLTLPTKLEV